MLCTLGVSSDSQLLVCCTTIADLERVWACRSTTAASCSASLKAALEATNPSVHYLESCATSFRFLPAFDLQVGTLFDDDGIIIRFMNCNVEGNGIRDSVSAANLVQQVQFNGLTVRNFEVLAS